MDRLTGRQAAERAGITYNTWKLARRTKGGRPAPDGIDQLTGRLWWWDVTIDRWRATRRPTHADVIAGDRRLHPRTVARHLRRHRNGECSCRPTPGDTDYPGATP